MATRWAEISDEIRVNNDYDGVRRRYLKDLSDYTSRETLIYVVDFLEPGRGKPVAAGLMLDLSDKWRFVEVTRNLVGPSLDIVLESPGGYAEAAESIVRLLRGKFDDIRFIIPNVAKSAATMLALSGNALVLDTNSELGPTDPQIVFRREGGSLASPAQSILDQFDKARDAIAADPTQLPVRGFHP